MLDAEGSTVRGLDPALLRNVRASKDARQQLARRPELVRWVQVTDEDGAQAQAAGVGPASDHSLDCQTAEQRHEEYTRLYAPSQLDPASHELTPAAAAALLRELELRPSDTFLDLGSARGTLVLVAAATTECDCCAGVELSPSSHAAAEAAAAQHVARSPDDAARLRFYCGDLREAALLRDFSVLYCGVGVGNRAALTRDLVQRLVALPAPPGSPRRRLVLAGFGIDVRGEPHEGRVRLVRAYALQGALGASGTSVALPLYTHTEGPRVLLEYSIDPPAPASELRTA